jgi:ABC-type transport system involved in multi-copper enzyme maturation permease subunit
MNAGIASKKFAIWGSFIAVVALIGMLFYALLTRNYLPQYEELPGLLVVLSISLGLVIFGVSALSILLGIVGLFGKDKNSAIFGIAYSIGFGCIMAFLSWYGQQIKEERTTTKSAESYSLSYLEPQGSYDYFSYKIQSDTYKFIVPDGYGDATIAYKEITQNPKLEQKKGSTV